MPKKFAGSNQKSTSAKERKDVATSAKKEAEARLAADEAWVDDDKHTSKKIKRKEDGVAKLEEKSARRAELRKLVEEDEAAMPASKSSKAVDTKLTRAEVAANAMLLERQKALEAEERKLKEAKIESQSSLAIDNPNRLYQEEVARAAAEGREYIGASGIDESVVASSAIASGYGTNDTAGDATGVLKMTFAAYSELHMPTIRSENPKLKKSQLEEKIWKQWQKAPENPRNV